MQTKFHRIEQNLAPYLIAEVGLNHNGSEELAIQMIESAAKSGAHCVKFQLYNATEFISKHARSGDGPAGSLAEFFKQFELPEDSWKKLAKAADANKVDFLCSVFDEPSLLFYKELLEQSGHNHHYLKIASTDLTYHSFLEKAKSMNFDILLSTGASNEDEVEKTVALVRPGLIFQCVSSYPANPSDYNLKLIQNWQSKFNLPVGISDHCESLYVSLAATALGASVIERHFTIDQNLDGPDQKLSSTPAQFQELAKATALIHSGSGDGLKQSTASEEGVRRFGRRSLYYSRNLKAGHLLEDGDLIAKRPGSSLTLHDGYTMIGKTLIKDVGSDEPVDLSDSQK